MSGSSLSLENISLLSAGYVTATLFTGRRVIIRGWRMVGPSAEELERLRREKDRKPRWIGAALCLEFEDGSIHHGYDPATVTELHQAFHSLGQARAHAF